MFLHFHGRDVPAGGQLVELHRHVVRADVAELEAGLRLPANTREGAQVIIDERQGERGVIRAFDFEVNDVSQYSVQPCISGLWSATACVS